jgi:citrate lyase beta subunit
MGFDGKTLIHPATLATTNQVFTPTELELEYATRVMEAAAAADGDVCIVDGQLIEELHVQHAQQLLALAARIQGDRQ